MRRPVKSMLNIILNARFSYLFFTVVMLFLLRPFVVIPKALTVVTDLFIWFLIISCVWAVHEKRKSQWLVIVMAAVAILADVSNFILHNEMTSWTSQILIILFLFYAVVAILFFLARQEHVTADMIMAGASEYVLIGVLWASLYSLIEAVYPGSFSFAGAKDWSGFLYFSFITLTTTGYGDLLPVSLQARSLAMFETITGQLFIAITVARLVSLYTVQGNKR